MKLELVSINVFSLPEISFEIKISKLIEEVTLGCESIPNYEKMEGKIFSKK